MGRISAAKAKKRDVMKRINESCSIGVNASQRSHSSQHLSVNVKLDHDYLVPSPVKEFVERKLAFLEGQVERLQTEKEEMLESSRQKELALSLSNAKKSEELLSKDSELKFIREQRDEAQYKSAKNEALILQLKEQLQRALEENSKLQKKNEFMRIANRVQHQELKAEKPKVIRRWKKTKDGICKEKPVLRVSSQLTAQLKMNARLTKGKLRKIRSIARGVFASEIATEKEKKADVALLEYALNGKVLEPGNSAVTTVLEVTNIGKLLSVRLGNLIESGHADPEQRVVRLAIVGDKGRDLCKLCIVIRIGEKVNSDENLTIISMYRGRETRAELYIAYEECAKKITELNALEVLDKNGDKVTWKVEKDIVGDLKWMSAVLGTKGTSANHPCVICIAPKCKNFAAFVLTSFPYRQYDASDPSYFQDPLFKVRARDVAIPFLHLSIGIVEQLANECRSTFLPDSPQNKIYLEKFDAFLQRFGILPKKVNTSLTGKQAGNILKNAQKMYEEVSCTLPKFQKIRDAFKELAEIRALTQSRQLSEEEISALEGHIQRITDIMKSPELCHVSMTPKWHILLCHSVPYAKEHRTLGGISEQGIESYHSFCDALISQSYFNQSKDKQMESVCKEQWHRNCLRDRRKPSGKVSHPNRTVTPSFVDSSVSAQ